MSLSSAWLSSEATFQLNWSPCWHHLLAGLRPCQNVCLGRCYILEHSQTITDKFPAHSGFQQPPLPPPHDFRDSWNQVSMLELSCYQLPTLDIIYSKVSSLVSLWPCLHVLFIHVYFALLCFSLTPCLSPPSHLLHFQLLQLMQWPLTPYIRLLILYDMLMLEYWPWFSFHCLLNPILTPLNLEPLFQKSGK